jgi:PAS domain S-box-containing protein
MSDRREREGEVDAKEAAGAADFLLRFVPLPLLLCGPEGRVLAFNEACARFLGPAAENLSGASAQEALGISPSGALQALLASSDPGPVPPHDGVLEMELGISPRGMPRRHIRAWAAHLPRTGDGKRMLALFFDSASKEPEAQELQSRYETLLDRSSDVIFRIRPDLVVLEANAMTRTVLGYEPAELVGRRMELPLFLPAEEIRRLRVMGITRIFREGIRSRLFRIHRKNGTVFWGLLSLAPLRRGRTVSSILGVLRDVSELYATREQLEQQHSQLRHTLAELEQAYRLQESFVANVTHELRTPLATVLITAEVLERGLAATVAPSQLRQLQLIRKNSLVLLDLINDLLDLAKLKREGFRVREERVVLEEFLRGILEAVEPLFHQKSLFLRVQTMPGIPKEIVTDPAMLRKILTNILSNAAKFTERGGAMLGVERSEETLRFSVVDTGIGIASQDLRYLFQEFRQLDGSDTRRFSGTGLGLAIAERFARLLGGQIEVASEMGKGSRFTVVLPIRWPDTQEEARPD